MMNSLSLNKVKPWPTKLLLTLAVAVACNNAAAQELERITVKAQYKEEDMQSVPIAITALSEQDIELRSMSNALDINETVPNINISKNTGVASGMKVFLRGIGEDESRIGADPAIGIYVDGVYIGRQTGALLDLADIQSIEVLRGPQGTLYGRNSNGGAIRVTTKQPTIQDRTQLKTSIGSDALLDTYLMVNKGLTDKLAAQISVFSKSRDGFMTNADNGEKLGDVEKAGARFAAHYYGEEWDLQFSGDFMRDRSEPGYPSKARGDGADIFTLRQSDFPLSGGLNGDVALGEFYNELYQRGAAFTAHKEFTGINFDSITAYRSLNHHMLSIISLPYYQFLTQDQLSQEFRLSATTEQGEWVTGLYLFRENSNQYSEFVAGSSEMNIISKSAALFGQYTYNLTEQLRLTGGLRYTLEDKSLLAETTANYWNATGRANAGKQDKDWGKFSWKGVVAYDFTTQMMGYLSVTTGFKSGGWSVDSFEAVDAESVITYEAGLKSDLTKALRLNMNVFYNDYTDLQINGSTAVGFTRVNAGDVVSYGFEANLSWKATEDISIDAFLGLLEAEYKSLTPAAAALINKDFELKQAPPLSYGINLTYFKAIGQGNLSSNLQYAYTDKQYNDLANVELIARDKTNLVNARVAYKWGTEVEYTVALWSKNLLDEHYAAAGTAGNTAIYPGDPRTYGLDFTVNF